MKRFLSLCALAGALPFSAVAAVSAASPASATPAALPASPVVLASGSPPSAIRVVTPSLPKWTVRSGDTLSGIGVATHRSWPSIWARNRDLIGANPNLIYVGQVFVIPPANYNPPVVVDTAPVVPSYRPPPATQHTTYRYTPAPQPVVSAPVNSGGIWGCIGEHESGNNPATNTGNGYYGAFQDTISAWRAGGGGPGLPSDYSYSEQLRVNQNLQAQVGWGAWPNTSRMCGV